MEEVPESCIEIFNLPRAELIIIEFSSSQELRGYSHVFESLFVPAIFARGFLNPCKIEPMLPMLENTNHGEMPPALVPRATLSRCREIALERPPEDGEDIAVVMLLLRCFWTIIMIARLKAVQTE